MKARNSCFQDERVPVHPVVGLQEPASGALVDGEAQDRGRFAWDGNTGSIG
jgi:hypothetical protein